MNECKKEYSQELSDKLVALMKGFVGKGMKDFPMPCVARWLNGTLLDIERGSVSLSVTVRPDMTNPGGFLHGGIQSTIIDDAMGTVCATLGYETAFLSTNLTVDFLGTAKAGDEVVVKAWVFREGASLIHTIGELYKDGDIIAKGQSNVFISNQPAAYVALLKGL